MWATLRQPCCRFSIATLGVCGELMKESVDLQTAPCIHQESLAGSESVRPAQGS